MRAEDPIRIARRYRQGGVIVDTNLLLLLLVGSVDQMLIQEVRRTRNHGFTDEAYIALVNFLAKFQVIVTTPHILTETSNFIRQSKESVRFAVASAFIKFVADCRERRPESKRLVQTDGFIQFGLTDSAILDIKPRRHLVLSVDARLVNRLQCRGVDAINFNHLRTF